MENLHTAVQGKSVEWGAFKNTTQLGQQSRDQAVPHISRSLVVNLAGIEHLCSQCCLLDLWGDGISVAKHLSEVNELQVLHICQPLDVPNQSILLFLNLFR